MRADENYGFSFGKILLFNDTEPVTELVSKAERTAGIVRTV